MNQLYFSYKSRYLNSESRARRLINIKAFSDLDRVSLLFNQTERFLLLAETQQGEKIFIRYPGKESARLSNPMPLDFRPVLLKADGTWLKDLSFGDIWDDITEF